jgi:glycosyltransferase involved in cell wall biosynthesis
MKSFDLFKERTGSDAKFLIVGQSYPESDSIYDTHSHLKYKSDVKFLGRISRNELDILVSGAIASSYVSNYEGFGLPILEAMRCGTAVISSNTSALPEVAGDAALLVDPADINSISEAYDKIANDISLRNSLIEKGNSQFKKFTWDKTAEKVWEVISSVR